MTYEQFYDISVYLNDMLRGKFTPRELAIYSYDYLLDYGDSVLYPTYMMVELCKDLVLCMDIFTDYIDCDWENLTIEQMNDILSRAWEEI